jgi:hypothetical protein
MIRLWVVRSSIAPTVDNFRVVSWAAATMDATCFPERQVADMMNDRGRRFPLDPRFVIGLALVAASVAGVFVVVAQADKSVAVYSASDTLSVGDSVDASDLVISRVRLEFQGDLYLTPDLLPDKGVVITRTVAKGELVPVSAVGSRTGETVTSVVVDVRGTLAGSIIPGSVVDVWAARAGEHSQFGPPAVLVPQAAVVRVVESSGLIAAGDSQSVEVLVPTDRVAAVLESIANSDAIALVPAYSSLGK